MKRLAAMTVTTKSGVASSNAAATTTALIDRRKTDNLSLASKLEAEGFLRTIAEFASSTAEMASGVLNDLPAPEPERPAGGAVAATLPDPVSPTHAAHGDQCRALRPAVDPRTNTTRTLSFFGCPDSAYSRQPRAPQWDTDQ